MEDASHTTPPPVVVISIDTLRSDRLPVYGYEGVETPALDEFARDAVVFERAYAHYPLTLPSHVALFSGRLPAAAGVRDNSRYRLHESVRPFLPELLSGAGYATAGAVSSFVLRADSGMARGFDSYSDVPLRARSNEDEAPVSGANQLPVGERSGEETLAQILPWLRERDDEPFFLFFHIYEPHLPHTPPEPFRERWGDTYEGEIAVADSVIGRLLDELRQRGVYEGALIFVLSDHGEEFGEHGEEGHGLLLYRQSLQVPLLMKLPADAGSQLAGRRHPHPVQLADVLPTVLDVVGLEGGNDLEGESLRRMADGSVDPAVLADRPIFSETLYPRIHYGWHELTSVVQGDLHLVAGLRAELFRITSDPEEKQDILANERRAYRALEEQRMRLATPFEPPGGEEDEETRRQLESLGYLSSAGGRSGEPTRDPRDVVPEVAPRLKRADDALKADSFEEAEALYQELLQFDDAMPATWKNLGIARMSLREFESAFDALARSLQLVHDPQVARMAGKCLIQLGRLDEAEEHLRLAWSSEGGADSDSGFDGGSEETRDLLVALSLARERPDEALSWARGGEGLEALPPETLLQLSKQLGGNEEVTALEVLSILHRTAPSAAAWNETARWHLSAGDKGPASEALQQAMKLEPRNAESLEWLGLLALEQGRADEARQLLTESVGKDSGRDNAWNLLAVARFQGGDTPGALEAWQQAVERNPAHLDALFNLGLTAARVGRRDLALRSLRGFARAAEADPARAGDLARVQEMIRGLGG